MTFARDLFKAKYLLGAFEDQLLDELEQLDIVDYRNFIYDPYDSSLEIIDAKLDLRYSEEQLEGLWKLGFMETWIRHTDGWETYYYSKVCGDNYNQPFRTLRVDQR